MSVAEGDAVEEGEVLGVMEAMKMELSLKAPFAGTVTAVEVAAVTRSRWARRSSWSTDSTDSTGGGRR